MFKNGIIVLLFINLATFTAHAQDPKVEKKPEPPRPVPRTGLGFYPIERLLEKMPAVRKELKLSPDQEKRLTEQIAKANAMYKQEGEQNRQQVTELGENPAPEQLAIIRRQRTFTLKELQAQIDEDYLKLLDRNQRERLLQIRLQLEGPAAFLRPEFRERLNFGPDQSEQVLELIAQGREQLKQLLDREQATIKQTLISKRDETKNGQTRTVFQIDPAKNKQLNADLTKLAKDADGTHQILMQKIERILTKRQRENYHKMLGPVFDPNPPSQIKAAGAP